MFLRKIQQRRWGLAFSLLTLGVNSICFWFFYLWLLNTFPPMIGISADRLIIAHPMIMISTIVVHELGHWVVYRSLGFRPVIFFALIGAVTWVDSAAWKARQALLSNRQKMGIYAAGVMANLWLMGVVWVIDRYVVTLKVFAPACYVINGLAIIGDLVPWKPSDGWHLMRLLRTADPSGRQSGRDRLVVISILAIIILLSCRAISAWQYI